VGGGVGGEPLEAIEGLGAKPPAAGGWCLGAKPQLPKTRGFKGGALSVGRFLQFFNKITHFYAYFSQNNCLKAITHQLKAFEKQSINVLNRVIKYKFCSVRISVTEYDVTFATKGQPPVTTPLLSATLYIYFVLTSLLIFSYEPLLCSVLSAHSNAEQFC